MLKPFYSPSAWPIGIFLMMFALTIARGVESPGKTTQFWVSGPKTDIVRTINSKDGRICVLVKINGSDYNFYIDTGASTTLHREIANRLKIKSSDSGVGSVDPSGAEAPIYMGKAKVKIGQFQINNASIQISDLSELRKMNAEQGLPVLDGILGSELLNLLRAKINFGESILVLLRPTSESLQ